MGHPLSYPRLTRRHRVWVHGHRGSAATLPENTFAGFEEAAAAGAELFELDLHLSADGVPVVFHDEFVSGRTCHDPSGRRLRQMVPVRRLPAAELRRLEVGSVAPARFPEWRAAPGSRIPLFAEVCRWAAGKGAGMNVEIKMGLEPRSLRPDPDHFAGLVVGAIREAGLEGRVQLQSFYPPMVAALRRAAPAERVSLLVDLGRDWVGRAIELGADVVGPRYSLLNERLVRRAQEAGLAVVPWTANDPRVWAQLVSWGVDGIITDYPRRLIGFLSRVDT